MSFDPNSWAKFEKFAQTEPPRLVSGAAGWYEGGPPEEAWAQVGWAIGQHTLTWYWILRGTQGRTSWYVDLEQGGDLSEPANQHELQEFGPYLADLAYQSRSYITQQYPAWIESVDQYVNQMGPDDRRIVDQDQAYGFDR